eukprot:CAMPEP_0181293654 /NCGR_PEP_ID=MMETSP1101-20121128/3178_1 /TAXON_ID=46948 /ORGANISM="Rhodomonas abbreviata, Strain Caron Lab Isolate" /LENGTH=408 /DNA_ID=CAMNT_0023398251 /DNA_START=179 /DNA_END=1402 /DNA_ORIENTATION=+
MEELRIEDFLEADYREFSQDISDVIELEGTGKFMNMPASEGEAAANIPSLQQLDSATRSTIMRHQSDDDDKQEIKKNVTFDLPEQPLPDNPLSFAPTVRPCPVPPSSPDETELDPSEEHIQGGQNPLTSPEQGVPPPLFSGWSHLEISERSAQQPDGLEWDGMQSLGNAGEELNLNVSDTSVLLSLLQEQHRVASDQAERILRLEQQLQSALGQTQHEERDRLVEDIERNGKLSPSLHDVTEEHRRTIQSLQERQQFERAERKFEMERLQALYEQNEQLIVDSLIKLKNQIRDLGMQDVPESWEDAELCGESGNAVMQAIGDVREEVAGLQSLHMQRGQELERQSSNLRQHVTLQDQVVEQLQQDLRLWQAGQLSRMQPGGASEGGWEERETLLRKKREVEEQQQQLA